MVLVGVFVMLLAGRAGATTENDHEITVAPGQSIQAAINGASPGTTINVQAGTYQENLEIIKDGIHLKGHHAVLKPPTTARPTRCDQPPPPAPANGICFAGVFNPTTGAVTSLHNVGVEGFTVTGFPGNGVLVFGANGFEAEGNEFAHNGGYGIFSLQSSRILYAENYAHDNGDAGFYIGDSPEAKARVEGNRSIGNHAEGIFFRDSTGARIEHNQLTGNCAGLIAIHTVAQGSAGLATIEGNWVEGNNQACAGTAEGPAFSGIGIALGSVTQVDVKENVVKNHNALGDSPIGKGGILVFTLPMGTTPSDVRVSENRLANNSPADLVWDGSGTNIMFSENGCTTSIPPGLCQASHED
jgi:nitrous oxidase accessory protein NosD